MAQDGTYQPGNQLKQDGSADFTSLAIAGVVLTSTPAELNLIHGAGRVMKMSAPIALALVDTAGGLFSWQNPESGAIVVSAIEVDVTTAASGTCGIDAGTTTVSGTTAATNMLSNSDVHTAATVAKSTTSQHLAAGKWVTGSVHAGGASAGIVGNVYIHYHPV